MKKGYIITIDGPAGAGKSTVSRQLAELLHGKLLDTGSMYRTIAFFSLMQNLGAVRQIAALARSIEFTVDLEKGEILANSESLGARIRTEEVGKMASYISRFSSVRKVLTKIQRKIGNELSRKFPVIVEGRDIGTVVFPDATFKFFVTANIEIRTERRYSELKRKGIKTSKVQIRKDIKKRDKEDMERKVAPLRCPDEAIIVDTSTMAISQVVQFLANHIQAKQEL